MHSRRAPGYGRVDVPDVVLVIWTSGNAGFRVGNGLPHTLTAGEFVFAAPGHSVELLPSDDGRRSRINALGISVALLGDIGRELAAVSHTEIRLNELLRDRGSHSITRVQPDWLTGLLADLDQAAALGLDDDAWLRRHVRLVWERLIFSFAARRRRPANRRARPRPSPRRSGLALRLGRVRQLMDREYHRPMDLKEMAAVACVSRYHFLREFRKTYGKTPYQLLLDIRLQAARKMLKCGDLPVQEISRQVGFASTDGFYRAFRRRYRRSPSEYRAAC
jgi:AraC-like DNA-binding protein